MRKYYDIKSSGNGEWDNPVLTVNGRPIRMLQEVDFGSDEPEPIVTGGATSIEFPLRIAGETMDKCAKAMATACLAFARLAIELRRLALRYRFRQRVERRHSRTRRRQRPTRLQRRRQRQTKIS